MKRQKLNFSNTLFLLFFCITSSSAQSFVDGLHLGLKFGGAKFMGETSGEVSGIINEFDNSYGPAYDLELSKYLGRHFEVGIEIGQTTLQGQSEDPRFSAEGLHYTMREGITEPVEYRNRLFAQKIGFSYYLRDFSGHSGRFYLNPYFTVGGGHLFHNAKLKYSDAPDDEIIFGKGKGNGNENTMTSGLFFAGAGLKASLSDRIFMRASACINFSNTDFLDVVYNYTPGGERLNPNGMYSEFKVGIFYNFRSNALGSFGPGNKKSNRNGGGSSNTSGHLPFSRRR